VRGGGSVIILTKWSWMSICLSLCVRAQPLPLLSRCMKFFRCLPLARRWKNLVLVSPSLTCLMRALCFLLAFSMTSHPNMHFFSFDLRASSSSDSYRKSCASSSRRITSWAMYSFCQASERREVAQALRALAVWWSLWPSRWKGSV
jgi:hypothetical protein